MGREGRDADIDVADVAGILDASIVGNIGVGDIHVRHDLEAGDQTLVKADGKEELLLKHSINAVIDARQVHIGHHMDIAGPQHQSFFDQAIPQHDDLIFLELVVGHRGPGDAVDVGVNGQGGLVVKFDGLGQPFLGGNVGFHPAAGDPRQLVLGHHIKGVVGGGQDGVFALLQRHDPVGGDELLGDLGDEAGVHLDGFRVQQLGAALHRQAHLKLLLGDPVQPQQHITQHDPGFLGFRDGHFQLIPVDKPNSIRISPMRFANGLPFCRWLGGVDIAPESSVYAELMVARSVSDGSAGPAKRLYNGPAPLDTSPVHRRLLPD
jgi:hypothetical protein